MKNKRISGSAIFIHITTYVSLLAAAVCFILYYGNFARYGVLLDIGVTAFTVMYHFGGRLLVGCASNLLPVHYGQAWFRERKFERKLYKFLRVRRWKEKVLTFDPDSFSTEKHTYAEIAKTMTKSEVDHWLNLLLSLASLLFTFIWGQFWVFFVTALVAMIFDAQFIIVQRFNRPIVLRVAKMKGEI